MDTPRSCFEFPSLFGKQLDAPMRPEPQGQAERAVWFAAATHHAVIVVAQQRMTSQFHNRHSLASIMGTSSDYLGRVFRGEVALSAGFLGGLESVLGPLTFVAVDIPHRDLQVRTLPRLDDEIRRALNRAYRRR